MYPAGQVDWALLADPVDLALPAGLVDPADWALRAVPAAALGDLAFRQG